MQEFEIIFETERIYFVKISDKLVNEYLIMINDLEVQKYISHNVKKYNLEQELDWIKDKLNKNAIIFSMIEKKTNKFIGNIEIMKIVNNVGEFGIAITSKQQNKHFGQEAISAFIDYALCDLNLDGLELKVYNFNSRAIHCYEKLGFEVTKEEKNSGEIYMKIMKDKLIKK